jgi:hypothetical protein
VTPTPGADDDRRVRRRAVVLAVVVAVGLAASVVAAVVISGRDGDEAGASGRVAGVGPQGGTPQFTVECAWSHALPDDPIVHPGRPGRSHLHDFFGNTTTDAASTLSSLLAGDTTCQQRLDTAAYWTPALSDGGRPVRPHSLVAYYRPGPGVDPSSLRPYPPDLRVIAGDPTATGPQALDVAAWLCGSSPLLAATPPDCPAGAPLGARITFPDCWNGTDVDSADHRHHLARSTDGRCPAGHPVPVPQLILHVRYPLSGGGRDLELASGGVHSLHADFVNAWDQEKLEREIRVCLTNGKVCGVVSNRATG